MPYRYKPKVKCKNIFTSSVRATDIVGRWGGEEFLIICPNTNIEELKMIAQNMRKKVVSHKFSKINQNISISIGLSAFQINKTITTIVITPPDNILNI